MAANAPADEGEIYDLSVLSETMLMLDSEDVPEDPLEVPDDSDDSTDSATIPTTPIGPRNNPFALLLPDNSVEDEEVRVLFSRAPVGSNQLWNRSLNDEMAREADRRVALKERLMNDINNLHSQVADGKRTIKKLSKKLVKSKKNLVRTMEESARRREMTRVVAEQRDALFNIASQLAQTIKDLQDTKTSSPNVNLPQSGQVGLNDVCSLLKYIQMILECNGIRGLEQSEEARLHLAVSRTTGMVEDALAYAQSNDQTEVNSTLVLGPWKNTPTNGSSTNIDELKAQSFFSGVAITAAPQADDDPNGVDSTGPTTSTDVKVSEGLVEKSEQEPNLDIPQCPNNLETESISTIQSETTLPEQSDRSSVRIWFDLTCCGWNVCWCWGGLDTDPVYVCHHCVPNVA